MTKNLVLGVAFLSFVIFYGLYFCTFSGGISTSHERWAEFGSYIGGTLTPVFSLLAVFFVIKQIEVTGEASIAQITEVRYEIKLREQLSSINFIMEFMLKILLAEYSVDKLNESDVSRVSGKKFSSSTSKNTVNIFQIINTLLSGCDVISVIDWVDNDRMFISTELKTFAAQFTHFLNLINELMMKRDKYSFNMSIIQYRLSLFEGTLDSLIKLNLIDDEHVAVYEKCASE